MSRLVLMVRGGCRMCSVAREAMARVAACLSVVG